MCFNDEVTRNQPQKRKGSAPHSLSLFIAQHCVCAALRGYGAAGSALSNTRRVTAVTRRNVDAYWAALAAFGAYESLLWLPWVDFGDHGKTTEASGAAFWDFPVPIASTGLPEALQKGSRDHPQFTSNTQMPQSGALVGGLENQECAVCSKMLPK